MLVQESIYDIVVERLAAQVSQVKAGMPDSDAECGPIITSAQFKRVQDFIDRIHVSGIELLAQGALDTVDDGGFLFRRWCLALFPESMS